MEKLGQLTQPRAADGTPQPWDLVIVDTPPSRSALDFLDAPKRLGSFLDGRFIRLLLAPARVGGRAYMKVVSVGIGAFTGVLSKVLGAGLLNDLQSFVAAMDSTFGGFRQRADQTYALLQAPGTSFVVVAAPEPDALREASYFVERLAEEGMPLAGLVVNRLHGSAAGTLSADRSMGAAEQLDEQGVHPLTAGLLRVHAERMQQVAREQQLVRGFTSTFPEVPVARAEALPSDVHDLDGLRAVARSLTTP